MKTQPYIRTLLCIVALTGCSSPQPQPFTFIYPPTNDTEVSLNSAAMTPNELGQLSPAAGGSMTGISHENDPGAAQLRDTENKKAIQSNAYDRLQHFLPTDY